MPYHSPPVSPRIKPIESSLYKWICVFLKHSISKIHISSKHIDYIMSDNWKTVDQIISNDIGIEIVEFLTEKEEIKRFLRITKFERTKQVLIPIEKADGVIDSMKKIITRYLDE